MTRLFSNIVTFKQIFGSDLILLIIRLNFHTLSSNYDFTLFTYISAYSRKGFRCHSAPGILNSIDRKLKKYFPPVFFFTISAKKKENEWRTPIM